MTPTAMIPMRWAEDTPTDNKTRCACCGKEIKTRPYRSVEVSADMNDALTPDLEWEDTGGFFPVGNGCAKKYLDGFTHPGGLA